MSDPMKKIIDLRRQLDEQIRKSGGEVFVEHFKPFFDKYPEVDGITWTQYTPYFNDGEPCVFDVHETVIVSEQIACGNHPEISEEDFYKDDYQHEYAVSIRYKATSKAMEDMDNDLHKFTNGIPSDIYLSVFGDHVKVFISRHGGVIVDEHEHD